MENYPDIKGARAFTNMKEPAVRKHIRCDGIPHIRVGRLIRFRPSQIEARVPGKERNTAGNNVVFTAGAANGELFGGTG
jgi:hypothetical protein